MAKKRNIYMSGKKRIPGATTVLGIIAKPALINWAANQAVDFIQRRWKPDTKYSSEVIEIELGQARLAHQMRKTEAGEFGSKIHEIVEAYIGGQLLPGDIEDAKLRRSLENFIKVTHNWEWIGSEITVVNNELKYGGTADGIARLPNGKIVIVDFKTSTSVHAEFDLQIAMYAMAKPDNKDLLEAWMQIEEGRIVHYNKEHQTWEVLERDIMIQKPYIKHICKVYEWNKIFSH